MKLEIICYIYFALIIICQLFIFFIVLNEIRKNNKQIKSAQNAINSYVYKAIKHFAPSAPMPNNVLVRKSKEKATVYRPSKDFDKVMKGEIVDMWD